MWRWRIDLLQFVECWPSPQSLFIGKRLGGTTSSGRRSQGVQAVEFCFRVTGTVVRWGVEEAVARHDAVEAPSPDPVVDVPRFALRVDELDSGARWQQETIGRLGNVAAVMKPVGLNVRGEGLDDLARPRISACEDAGVLGAGGGGGPNQVLHDQEILGRLVSGLVMWSGPEHLAGFRIQRAHRAVASGKKQHVLVKDKFRAKVEIDFDLDRAW